MHEKSYGEVFHYFGYSRDGLGFVLSALQIENRPGIVAYVLMEEVLVNC